jgi:hypothetical protein
MRNTERKREQGRGNSKNNEHAYSCIKKQESKKA